MYNPLYICKINQKKEILKDAINVKMKLFFKNFFLKRRLCFVCNLSAIFNSMNRSKTNKVRFWGKFIIRVGFGVIKI